RVGIKPQFEITPENHPTDQTLPRQPLSHALGLHERLEIRVWLESRCRAVGLGCLPYCWLDCPQLRLMRRHLPSAIPVRRSPTGLASARRPMPALAGPSTVSPRSTVSRSTST